jgi:hypothetical protein
MTQCEGEAKRASREGIEEIEDFDETEDLRLNCFSFLETFIPVPPSATADARSRGE